MVNAKGFFEAAEKIRARLDEEQGFPAFFFSALPPIMGFDGRSNVHARGEFSFKKDQGETPRLLDGRGCGED